MDTAGANARSAVARDRVIDGERSFIAVRMRTPLYILSVERGAGGVRIVHAGTLDALKRLAATDGCVAIAYEPGYDGPGRHELIAPIIGQAICPVVVAMTAGKVAGAVAEFREMLRHPREHCAYVAWPDETERAIRNVLLRRQMFSGVASILDRVLPDTPISLHAHAIRATIMTQAGTSVELLARAGKLATSTLRACFRTAAVAPPKVWVGGLQSVHAGHRHLVRGMTVEKAAKLGGFNDQSGLSHCATQWTDHPLTWWRDHGGLDALLDECVRRCLAG